MPKPWEKYGGTGKPWEKYSGVRSTPDPASPEMIIKAKRPLSAVIEEMQDSGLSPEEVDRHIIKAWGYNPDTITRSRHYQPGMLSGMFTGSGDLAYSVGQVPGGTTVLGLGEGVGGPLRQLAKGSMWAQEKLGLVKREDKELGEIMSNIAHENYKYSTTDPTTGKGNVGQEAAPIVSQMVLGNKLGPLSKVLANPTAGGALLGAAQDVESRGGEDQSSWADSTFQNALGGAAVNTIAAPVIGAGVNKLARTRLGQNIGMAVQQAPATLESMAMAAKQRLTKGRSPGEVLKEALAKRDLESYLPVKQGFSEAASLAPAGDMPMPRTIQELDDAIVAFEGKGNPPAMLAKLKQFRDRLSGASQDPRPMNKQFQDIMDEYKIFNSEMQQAFDQGGGVGANAATAGDRGSRLRSIKNAMLEDSFVFSPQATQRWDEARGQFADYAGKFKGTTVEDMANAKEPNALLAKIISDTHGDKTRMIGEVLPKGGEAQAALQAGWLENLMKSYATPTTRGGGGVRSLASDLTAPESQASLDLAFSGPERQSLRDIASRAKTAQNIGYGVNAAVGAVGGEIGLAPMGLSHTGLPAVGGAIGAARFIPNYSAKPVFRMLESPNIRRLISFKTGIPENSPEFQRVIQEISPETITAWSQQAGMEPTMDEYQ